MSLQDELKGLLGDVVSLYFRAHGHHWNVEGEDFAQYHKLFQKIYEDVYSSIDPIAENIRKLGDYAPFRLERFAELATIPDSDKKDTSPKSLAKDLLKANTHVLERLRDVYETADKAREYAIANFLADRLGMHQKWDWQLKASVG
jgi:starvation-inducible DNA-binding protein